MLRLRPVLLPCVFVAYATSSGTAGVELVEIAKVQVVREISGVVRDPSGAAISGATVAEVSADHKTVLRSVTTDKDGKFTFPRTPNTKIYNLMVSTDGFNPLLVHVRTSRWVKRLLDLRLEIST